MTQEDKQLLLKDLCARLPYGVIVEITSDGGIVEASYDMRLDAGLLADLLHSEDDFKPYLRPMSSMTEEEVTEFISVNVHESIKYQLPNHETLTFWECSGVTDWLNTHHFDYRGLIPMGLALEAPEDIYKTE